MKTLQKKLILYSLFLSLTYAPLLAEEKQKAKNKQSDAAVALYQSAYYAANVSLAFFALGQSSYHLGNLLSGCWLEQQFKDSAGYKQSVRFGVGMVGTSLLLAIANGLSHFGYSTLAGQIDSGLAQTEDTVDSTAQAQQSASIS